MSRQDEQDDWDCADDPDEPRDMIMGFAIGTLVALCVILVECCRQNPIILEEIKCAMPDISIRLPIRGTGTSPTPLETQEEPDDER